VLDLLKVIILGIVEGITEFLPISSTGHLIVAVAFLRPNFSEALSGTFEIFIQLGAVVAVVLYYRNDFIGQVRTVIRDRGTQRLWLALILATVPAALIGFPFREQIKAIFFNPTAVAISLIIGGVLFIVLERWFSGRESQSTVENSPSVSDLTKITPVQALLIGVLQTLALIPGVSRAATSIFGGMLFGLDRKAATRFSFYLAVPVLGGATVFDLLLSLDEISSGDLIYLLVGAVVSGIVAWFAIDWLLHYVARHNFVAFGYYRIAAGAIILVLAALSLL